ncbi:MAG: hypothetical protein WD334_04220 [Chitinophagales bacterium]
MKRLINLSVITVIGFVFMYSPNLLAQAPQSFNYQAVARDANGSTLEDQNITVKFSILNGSPSGSLLYEETHNISTNQFGLFDAEIGNGNTLSGDFTQIAWGAAQKWLKVELDPEGGSNYVTMGTTQLLSVPYALYADSANVPGVPGPAGADGQDGADGESAYEVWLGLGNTGSETDFINSLEGPAGADGQDGATGPQGPQGDPGPQGPQGPPGADGQDGADGESAYETWLSLGNTGSETDFINSLEGPVGPAGADGADGADGNAKAVDHAGYDLTGNFPKVSSTSWEMWDWSTNVGYGDASATVSSGDKIYVSVSAMVYKNDLNASNELYLALCPCYSTNFSNPTDAPFAGQTRPYITSSGFSDMSSVTAQYVFTGLSGTYNFSLCARRVSTSTAYSDFGIRSPKVSVVVY